MTKHRVKKKKRTQTERDSEQFINTKFTMKRVNPMTETQHKLFDSYEDDKNIMAIGCAGTGKTYVSLYLAIEEVMSSPDLDKVVIVRSAVQSRDQGFMPGKPEEKMEHYELPYIEIVNKLFGRGDAYSILKAKGMIQFMSTSFCRGITLDRSVVILDEVQNCNFGEIDTVMTRIGDGSKIIFCGDVKQDDLERTNNRQDISGLRDFIAITNRMKSFETIEFVAQDIVRSGLVKEYILAKESM